MDAAARSRAEGLAAGAACLEAGLGYLARGWSVLCLCPPDHVGVGKAHAQGCSHPGKRPLANGGAWKEYQERLPTEDEVRAAWGRYPNANVGAALGPASRLVRVDVEGAAAEARLLEASGGDLPPTCAFRSGRRDGTGRGLLYALPDGVEARTSVQGLEAGGELRVQGLGAQTVLPPSRHPDKDDDGCHRVYAWESGCSPAEIDPAPAPAWLLALLEGSRRSAVLTSLADGEVIPYGQCDTRLTSMAGHMRRCGFNKAEIRAALLARIEAGGCETQPGKRPYDESDAERISNSIGAKPEDPYANVTLVRRELPNGHAATLPQLALESGGPPPDWPEPPAPEVYHGLAGDVVRAIEPETEADPVALLLHFLTMFGNVIGRHAFRPVGPRRHYGNLFCVLVGRTAKGRKGTALSWVEHLFGVADPEWVDARVQSGLSTGEGLISAVRDATRCKKDPAEVLDAGVEDKRLMVVEEEFSAILRMAQREGNILSTVLRQAWDAGRLRTLTRHNPLRATDAHVSIIGHVTRDELLQWLGRTDGSNGFANRFLWGCVRRSKLLPDGGDALDLRVLAATVADAVRFGRDVGMLGRDAEARALWHTEYPTLSADRPGLYGLVTSRAEAQVLRLSVLYALLDGDVNVRAAHLHAALAVWDYCARSCRWIFGESLGSADADDLIAALRASPAGLTLTQISALFGRHKSAADVRKALAILTDAGLVTPGCAAAGGKPATPWVAKAAKAANPPPTPPEDSGTNGGP